MKLKLLVVVFTLMFSVFADAKLAGKNVILVHGFRTSDLSERPSIPQQKVNSLNYWSDFWTARAEGHLAWSGAERLNGQIKDALRSQIKSFEQSGLCVDGCVIVTHSTGDLVTRYALSRLGQWGIDRNRFKVLAVLDLAGAGGGSELADLAVNAANGSGLISSITRAIGGLVFDIDFTESNIGVINDLRVSTARATAAQNNIYPRLRFVGGGTAYLGLTKPFIRGSNDSVVGLHSSCGGRYAESIDSCSNSIRLNGQVRSANGPSSLYYNHFPILMGETVDHFEVRTNDRPDDDLTIVLNNRTYGGINVDFATKTSRRYWSWFYKVRTVIGGTARSFSATIYNTLN